VPCPAGTVGVTAGLHSSQQCQPCFPGNWCNSGVANPCSAGFHTDSASPSAARATLDACKPCPLHATSPKGSATAANCSCQQSYYLRSTPGSTTANASCVACPTGTNCDEAGTTLLSLPVSRTYWKPGYLSVDVKPCPFAETCASGHTPNAAYDAHSDATCARGRGVRGVYCLLCAESYYLDEHELRCVPCSSEWVRVAFALATIVVGCTALALVLRSKCIMVWCTTG
jgi:hypothetical protein